MIFRTVIQVALIFSGVLPLACESEPTAATPPTCLAEPVDMACMPQYAPTYANVFKYTLARTCAQSGCHEGNMPQGGLRLDDIDEAYTNLLDKPAGRIIPGDLACGKVIVRLETKGASWSMPRGQEQLALEERCSIRQWIANGAER
jgi:hypothetical protein